MQAIIFDLDKTLFKTNDLLHDGVSELLFILQQLGVQMGALSSHDHRVIVRLEEAGIRPFFSSIVCNAHMDEPKAVVAINRVLQELGTQAHNTALASHLHTDILLAQAAGLAKTIGISHESQALQHLRQANPHHIVSNIPGILDVLQ